MFTPTRNQTQIFIHRTHTHIATQPAVSKGEKTAEEKRKQLNLPHIN